MRRSMTILLLIGYAALAPFCFLAGSPSFSSAHAASPTAHCLMGMGCHDGNDNTSSSPINTVAEHLGMYLSLTGELQNSFLPIFILMICAVAIGFTALIARLFAVIFATETLRSLRQNRGRRAIASRVFLRWLKLNTISPPVVSFAY